MNIIPQDLRYACRTLSRSRSFVCIATLMLALGIGANTAIFSVVLTVLIRPLPYADAERVVWLSNRNSTLGVSGAFLNPADILDFCEQSQSFERIAAWGTLPVNLYGASSLERVEGVYVTPNSFAHSACGLNSEETSQTLTNPKPLSSLVTHCGCGNSAATRTSSAARLRSAYRARRLTSSSVFCPQKLISRPASMSSP